MNPNTGNSGSWQGASYFFQWKKEESDWLMLNSGFMRDSDNEVWLSSLTRSKSAMKGFGKEFRPVKYTWEYADRDMLLWQEAMQELKTQTAGRKAAEKEWARKVKNEEVKIAKFLSQRADVILEEKRQANIGEKEAKNAKRKREIRRTLRTLNNEAAADAIKGGKGLGKKPKGNKTSQSTGVGEGSNPRENTHRREGQTAVISQSSKGERGDSSNGNKDRRR